MYNPKHFQEHDQTRLIQLIRAYPFATILSYPHNDHPRINHFPVICKSDNPNCDTLIGHMAKMNPQWKDFVTNPKCTMLIHGPNTYITPTWYKSGCDVPTWNYAVAHLHGEIQLIEDYESQIHILKAMSAHFEKSNPNPWQFELPPDLSNPKALTASIVSFEFKIQKAETKFKLSQNRSVEDQLGVRDGLKARQDESSQAILDLMKNSDVHQSN